MCYLLIPPPQPGMHFLPPVSTLEILHDPPSQISLDLTSIPTPHPHRPQFQHLSHWTVFPSR